MTITLSVMQVLFLVAMWFGLGFLVLSDVVRDYGWPVGKWRARVAIPLVVTAWPMAMLVHRLLRNRDRVVRAWADDPKRSTMTWKIFGGPDSWGPIADGRFTGDALSDTRIDGGQPVVVPHPSAPATTATVMDKDGGH